AGHEIISLSRGIRARAHVYPVRNVKLDLVRPEGLGEALHGVAAVIHSAGLVREEAGQSFERAHVGATANLIESCTRAGIGKIVYLSALGANAGSSNLYLRTKWEAERLVTECGVPHTIFRPSLIFGAGDRVITGLLSWVRMAPFVPVIGPDKTKLQPIWVGDVATALVKAAADASTDGRVYELGGPTQMTFADLVETLRGSSGRSAFSLQLPAFLATPFMKLGELLMDNPPLTVAQFGALALGGTCDPNPAAVTFGLRMRSLVDVLPEYHRAG
ncbi:MAG: NAD-dependent epimerase/dehydratase family protein, partial [Myxococcales bacterium]